MKKDVTLYNVLFPLWMLLLFPVLWLIVLPGNFIIDSLVLIVSMFLMKMPEKKDFYKKNILKIFGFGLLADLVGSVYMLIMMLGFELGRMGDEWYLTVPALLIASGLIFVFNYFITFKSCEKKTRFELAFIFAVVTAPYTFLVPSRWLYGY